MRRTIINRRSPVRDESGYVLLTVLLVLVALTALVTVAQTNSRIEQTIGANATINTQSYYAAEAGAEKLLAAVRAEMNTGLLTLTSLTNMDTTPPTISGYTFTEYGANLDSAFTTRSITQGPFAGLVSVDRDLVVSSSVSGPAGSRSSVNLMARVQTIPIFQFATFYEDDLEIDPLPRMDLTGRVHTNGELWLRGDQGLYLWDMVTAAGDFHLQHKHTEFSYASPENHILKNDGNWAEITKDTHNYGGDDDPATFPSAAQDAAFDAYSESTWDHKIMTRASGVEPLELPIPSGIQPYELIEPCTGTEGSELKGLKYACNADIVIMIRGAGVEILDVAGAPIAITNPTAIRFRVNQFYDDREQSSIAADENVSWNEDDWDDPVAWAAMCDAGVTAGNSNSNRDVIDIDMNKFDAADYGDGVFYVTADSVGPSGTVPGCMRQYVVRLHDGPKLRAPLSVATNLPLYVLGDYNNLVNDWQPASVVADAVTLLSDRWDDSKSGEGKTEKAPDNTEVYAAIRAGHSPTPFYGSPDSGGQLENFPRFLEEWNGKTMTIIGSFVSLWFPKLSTAGWACCDYYYPPARDWGFEVRFRDPNTLPPMTPVVGQILRVGFVRRY